MVLMVFTWFVNINSRLFYFNGTERGLGGTSLFRLPGSRLDPVQVIVLQQEECWLCFYILFLPKAVVKLKAEVVTAG